MAAEVAILDFRSVKFYNFKFYIATIQLPNGSGADAKKMIFKMVAVVLILDFRSTHF